MFSVSGISVFGFLLVLLVFTCSAYARAGPSNCTKKAGTSGCLVLYERIEKETI